MTRHERKGDPLDPSAIAAQAAALADHFARSGIDWLPKPRTDAVQELQTRMSATATHGPGTATQRRETLADQSPAPDAEATSPPSLAANLAGQSGGETSPRHPHRHPHPPTPPAAAAMPGRLIPVDPVTSSQGSYPGDPLSEDHRQEELDQLAQVVSTCQRCAELSRCRNKTVFGEGSVTPRVAFFGEGPGADEDRTGRPFVGRAGQLLTKMIEACKFRRADVYILNTVKCRPPGNRNPEPEEVNNCREYYQQQLAILRPEYIVCLGAVSAQELLQSKLSVGRLRGRLHRYFESKVLVTYHPAYLLRNPSAKKAAWEDLQIMLRDAKIQY